ncbi:Protein of unknown function (DUF2948) [Roseinatronobacter thiooxidans]|uniref:DUF2948 family protein n=1 Tax=Roseinatronobacter thiooxidans TaxID=121821 RepID=A0A2W7RLZ9_9RHOB|nr:DUF2948 family protein [Roseinatronobacter thiooxidans]PZX38972.1 Protein of unknown function (DUF2948) [Roseinatronobacter thiooxidans]
MTDARFEDGAERPLRLQALDADDLKVISALVQDAVFPTPEMTFDRKRRRFALLINRFRWEDRPRAERGGDFERVQSVLLVNDVMGAATTGFDRADADLILSLLALEFRASADGAGHLSLILAGDGEIRLEVECLDVALSDVTRPYRAPSRKAPEHPLDKDS